MNVKELISILEALPEEQKELQIALYLENSEDMEFLNGIVRVETEENGSYCKGDHVLEYSKEDKVLILS